MKFFSLLRRPTTAILCSAFLSSAILATAACAQISAPPSTPSVSPPVVVEAKPPQAQASTVVRPGTRVVEGRTLIPITFFANSVGASLDTIVAGKQWQLTFFGHTAELFAGQKGARFDGESIELPIAPRIIGVLLYVPFPPLAELFEIRWSRPDKQPADKGSTLLLIQYQAAYIEKIRHSAEAGKVRIVLELSNATRVTAQYNNAGVQLNLAAARKESVPGTLKVGDIAVPRVTTTSGNWKASTQIKLNYAAPATWFTTSNPPRIVVDVQKIFEKSASEKISMGLTLTKIFRGTSHGPVRLFVATVDPESGWRLRVAPAGYSVLQRQRPSRIAAAAKAPLAINGGFFAFDGAAVGAMKVNGEWIRLPWKGRTAIAFTPKGEAKIGNMQVDAVVRFSSGLNLPIRDLNGWPDKNRITALTRRFRNFYELRPGETAAVVENGVVTSTPGSGGVSIPAKGFVLVANGGGKPELQKARRGLRAELKISSKNWDAYSSALGGGPRLVSNGKAEVKVEGFRSDVTSGLGPRTAIGIDKAGRYLILVADGRQGHYSTGLTLNELAQTLKKLGAVNALNLDGGGSTAMAMKGKTINRPSDGSERRVSNAVLVMR